MENRILLVDDEDFFLNGLSRAIRKFCNFRGEVMTAGNGNDAINAVKHSFFSICFLDMNLPDSNGIDVMNAISTLSPNTRVIIMTAGSLTEDVINKIRENGSVLLSKPLDFGAVKSFINESAGHRVNPYDEK